MSVKNQNDILAKLRIDQLNPMQQEAQLTIQSKDNVVLLSPTGTGKTLAFLLPIIETLNHEREDVQVMILVPSRELAIQIESVVREMGTGYKVNAVYGGKSGSKEKIELKHLPAILIGTPGRVADHMRRRRFPTRNLKTLILDEFDKSLEVGFEEDMKEIIGYLRWTEKRILTSATKGVSIPSFVGLNKPTTIDYLDQGTSQLKIKRILSPEKDKLATLVKALSHIGNQPGIVFCNFKNTIERVSDFLAEKGISHGCFYGGMEQIERERILIKFRNGTYQLIIATDLAARGLDIPELGFILHYQLPHKAEEFIHRNGRTARMNSKGTAYLLQWDQEPLPEYVQHASVVKLKDAPLPASSNWQTLFISGGRKDKISKGDIAGVFFKQAQFKKEEVGNIEIKNDCAFVAISSSKVKTAIKMLDNIRIKKKKVRVSLV